jgi:uncharacterized protein with PIN domain
MSDRVFLDTNILIYGYSQDEPDKQQRAINCVQSGEAWISTQVLNETINVFKRKFLLEYSQIRAVVKELTEQFEIANVSVRDFQIKKSPKFLGVGWASCPSRLNRAGKMPTPQMGNLFFGNPLPPLKRL